MTVNSQNPTTAFAKRGILWGGIAVAFGVAALAFFGWRTISDQSRTKAIVVAIDNRDFPAAEQRIAEFQRAHPDSAEAEYLRARLAMQKDEPGNVLIHLKNARDLGYPEPPMNRLVGLIHAKAKRPGKAEPLLVSSWDQNSEPDPDVADALCRIYVESFRFKPALAVIDRWLSESPKDVRALLWRAEVHSRNDPGVDILIRDYDAVLTLDPEHLGSRIGRANALRQVGHLEDAKIDYERYLAARPNDAEALFGAAKTAEGLDEESDALAFYERALRIDPQNVLGLLGKAAILLNRKDSKGALELLDLAIARLPHDPEPHYRRGQALERLGRSEEAKTEFAERRRLQTEQEYIEKIRKGLVRNPGDLALMVDATAWLLGHGYQEQGLEWAKKTLSAQPNHVPTLELLIALYQKQGNDGLANFYRSQLPPAKTP